MGALTADETKEVRNPLDVKKIEAAKPRERDYKLAGIGGLYLFFSTSIRRMRRLKYRVGGKERRLDEAVLGRFARRDVVPFDASVAGPGEHRIEVSSVPLSPTIIFSLPRWAVRLASARTTLLLEIDVSTTARIHSRATSSTMLSTRNRRPVTSWSCTKPRLQRW